MGYFRFRSPLLSESRLLSFPPGTEMVHFPGFARARLWIQRAVRRVYRRGFPHSEIPGSKPACGSPRLIAACHVLHRLLLPRHPPCALSSLTIKFTQRSCGVPQKTGRFHSPFEPAWLTFCTHPGKRWIYADAGSKALIKLLSLVFTQSIQLSKIVLRCA